MGRGASSDKYKARPIDLKIFTDLIMGLGKRQIALLLGRYKFFVITLVFFLVLWVGFSGSEDKIDESSVPSRQLAVKEEKRVKEIPDFDYKYDDDKKT